MKITRVSIAIVLGLAIAIGGVIYSYFRHSDDDRAKVELSLFLESLLKMKGKCGQFPTEFFVEIKKLPECAKEYGFINPERKDPWGFPYAYVSNGEHFLLKTTGPVGLAIDDTGVVYRSVK